MARLVVITPNPAVDVTYTVAEHQVGESIRVRAVARRAGGKGLNVVRVLHALGRPALALQPLGGAGGRWCADELQRLGIAAEVVPSPAATRNTVTVVDGTHHPTVLNEPGEPLPEPVWDALVAAVERHAEPGGSVVVSGSFPPATDPDVVRRLVARGQARGARVVVDTSGPALLAAAGCDVLAPNAAELVEATGATDPVAGARLLVERGTGAVVVSRGRNGLVGVDRDEVVTQQAVPRVTGNPTGAGDAATAGLVAALDAGGTLTDALRLASVVGAAAVLAPTAGDVDPSVLPALAARLPTDQRPTEFLQTHLQETP